MKKFFLTFVVFSVLLLIGCQENSITDPIQYSEFQEANNPTVHKGTIILESRLQDPYPVMNSYYIIDGEIQYQHILKFLDPITPNQQNIISLNFSFSADFTYLCTVCEPQSDDETAGTIAIETNDSLYVPKEDIYMLEKTFLIQGRDDGMFLTCRFLVNTDSVELNEMWLELNDGRQTSNDLTKNVGHEPFIYPLVANNQIN